MTNGRRKHLFAYLMALAVTLPVMANWVSASSASSAPDVQARLKYEPNIAGLSAAQEASLIGSGSRLVQLTDAEVAALGLPTGGVTAYQQPGFANPAFQRIWDRTDKLVASGQVKRSWYWGPQPNSAGLQEPYAEGAGGTRLVQYFDKSRMEINNPAGDPNNPFFVTNGLLTVELISGKMQTGNSTYVDRWPANIPLASDPDDPNAPTYVSFQGVSNTSLGDHPANANVGQPATLTIQRDGTVGNDPTKSSYPDTNIVYFDPTTKHNVPKAIWDFLNQTGPVTNPAGQVQDARLSDPWFYATGLPISEAYWARVKIAGQMQDVLIQAFERRVVTYVPAGVPGFKVQMGNIGQHYYDWRYNNAGQGGTPVAPPTTTPGTSPTPTTPPLPPTNTPPPPTPENCANIPPSQNSTVTPNCGEAGTEFTFRATGFQPGENVGVYVTLPDQSVYGADFQVVADSAGAIDGIFIETLRADPEGIWAFTGEGTSSHARAIGYFKVYRPASAPTATPGGSAGGCDDVPASTNVTIAPSNCARAGTVFAFLARGFQPGENVGVYVTAPDQSVFGAPFQAIATGAGTAGPVTFSTQSNFPLGIWAMTFEGVSSHARAIGYFKLTPP